jgi:hypothetical protein
MKTSPETVTLNLVSDAGRLVMKRELSYRSGDEISFSIALPHDSTGLTVAELHKQSVERVIQLLQDWIAPQ